MAAQTRRGRRLCPSHRRTTFPEPMRSSPREIWPWAVDKKIWAGGIPEQVPWISGVLAPADATIVSAPADDRWRQRWCGKLYSCLLDAATTRTPNPNPGPTPKPKWVRQACRNQP